MEAALHNKHFQLPKKTWRQELWLLPGAFAALCLGHYLAGAGIAGMVLLLAAPIAVGFLVTVFFKPKLGLIAFMVYSFVMPWLGRHFAGQFGLLFDGILGLIWLSVIFWRTNRYRFRHVKNDLFWLCVVWMVLSVLELGNPSRPSPQGWVQEVRGMALYWLMLTPLVFLLMNKKKDIDLFFNICIILSVVAALYGVKQLFVGVDAAERAWLEAGAKRTHILFGKLRVFSFYFEAAQFGASQGQLAIMCFILASGPHGRSKKLYYLIAGLIIFYGMLISGTRGAMGALIGGGLVLVVVSKKIKIIMGGAIVGVLFIGFLKFTTIGNNNDQIRRLRSSTDANDASLQVRLINQKRLSEYLNTRPFGTGVGTIGMWGATFNKHIPISGVPPDSMFVKIWVQYGVIGFIIFLGIVLYITGKAVGIIWRTRDPVLANQLIALTGGSFGALVCSYGNEVMNQMPTSVIVYVSWALIWLSPRWDKKPLKEDNASAHETTENGSLPPFSPEAMG